MKDLAGKFTKEENFMTDFCFGTCPTVKTCKLFDQLKKFVGCDLNSNFLRPAEIDLLITFALRALNLKSDITGDKKIRAAARMFKEKMTVVSACKKATVTEVPPRLDGTLVMARHILHSLCTLYESNGLYGK